MFACPDRPEVRAHQLSIMREIVGNYDVDGISLDYIRYENDRACYCDFSDQKRAEFVAAHPELSTLQAEELFSKISIMGFIQELRQMMDEINPSLILHGYCHQEFSNEFPLDYNSKGVYVDEDHNIDLVLEGCRRVVAENGVERGVPCIKCIAKSVTRLRQELRVASYAGADKIMMFCYSGLSEGTVAPDGSSPARRRRVYQEEFS